MEITVLCFKFVDFTVTNNCLLSDNLCIAYDEEIHYTLKHWCVYKSSFDYSETHGKNSKSENKRFISHVNYRDLFHREISVNHTYLYNN